VTPEPPSLKPAIDAVEDFAASQGSQLGPKAQETLREVSRRLTRLSVLATELVEINNRLMANEGLSVDFDPATNTLVLRGAGIEQRFQLRRANPDVPITMRPLTEGGAYRAGSAEDGDSDLRLELESKIEGFYQSAHRVLKLLGSIPELSKISCMPITRVRNNLIEHPDDGALYSFGFGSTGPRVKPMHEGDSRWNDDGLIPNTVAFVSAIVAGFSKTGQRGPVR
jgi:hypothetical protein